MMRETWMLLFRDRRIVAGKHDQVVPGNICFHCLSCYDYIRNYLVDGIISIAIVESRADF